MKKKIRAGRCPLCLEPFQAKDLVEHINDESAELRRYTIQVIQSEHPEWVAEDGACPRCWEYYSKL